MLESAITKSSKSVVLDLLTYEDLEAMWKKKLGTNKRGRADLCNPQAKRYLILTYSVEFDRIHYPLALTYIGCPDPAVLQNTIRKLQAELDVYKQQVGVLIGMGGVRVPNKRDYFFSAVIT
jgi:coiled-coil domain-containing protein 61